MAPKKTAKKTVAKKPAKSTTRRGRPPVHPPGDNRRIMVRCSKAEETAFKAAAERSALKVSPWARGILNAAADGTLHTDAGDVIRLAQFRGALTGSLDTIEQAADLLEEFSTEVDESVIMIMREQARYVRKLFDLPEVTESTIYDNMNGSFTTAVKETIARETREIPLARHPDGSTVSLTLEGELPSGFTVQTLADLMKNFDLADIESVSVERVDPLDEAETLSDDQEFYEDGSGDAEVVSALGDEV